MGHDQESAARELQLYTENDGDLYRQQTTSILKNLATKAARGEYKHDLAVKAFEHLAENGAKKYAKEFGGTWHVLFPPACRREVAKSMTDAFEVELNLGNYDNLLPKKYTKARVERKVGGGAARHKKAKKRTR